MALLTEDEQTELRSHGLAIYRDRLILEAQPPITEAQITEVEARLTGPIPDQLRALWSAAFGGRLDYDLSTAFEGYRFDPRFEELFYPGSDHCLDLWGWFDEEQGLVQPPSDHYDDLDLADRRLDAVPIGGYDEWERFYVDVARTPGRVLVLYRRGLQPDHDEPPVEIADSLDDLFDELYLERDPFSERPQPNDRKSVHGQRMVETVHKLRGSAPRLADRVAALIQQSVFDWWGVVERGPFTGADAQNRAGWLALRNAAGHDDVPVAEMLLRHRYPIDVTVRAHQSGLTLAMQMGAFRVAKHLLDAGQPLGHAPVGLIHPSAAHLVDRCIDADLNFSVDAPLSLAQAGKVDAALRVAFAGLRHGDWTQLEQEAEARAERAAQMAAQLEKPAKVQIEDYATQAQALRRFIHGLREDV